MFQSTPPAEARGDVRAPGWCLSRRGFNPLPPPKRGETNRPDLKQGSRHVSIHSPRRSEGRRCGIESAGEFSEGFQSTPPPKRGETEDEPPTNAAESCFNPLPPPKRGETPSQLLPSRSASSFNPLPPPKRGETQVQVPIAPRLRVSIHSPRRSEGRRCQYSGAGMIFEFQSTPPAEARGDEGWPPGVP